MREKRTHDRPEIDAEVLDPRTVRDREIGGDPHEQLVQRKPLRAKRDEIGHRQSGQIGELLRLGMVGERILRAEDRDQAAQPPRHLRIDPRIPRTEVDVRAIGIGNHGGYDGGMRPMPGSFSAGLCRSNPVTNPSTFNSNPSSPPAITPRTPPSDNWTPVPLGVRAMMLPPWQIILPDRK